MEGSGTGAEGARGNVAPARGDLHPSALVLLEGADAKRLAVAWQYLGEDRSDLAWATLAAVPRHRALAHMEILRRSGICREDGTVDPLALRYIGARAMTGIKPAPAVKRPELAKENG